MTRPTRRCPSCGRTRLIDTGEPITEDRVCAECQAPAPVWYQPPEPAWPGEMGDEEELPF